MSERSIRRSSLVRRGLLFAAVLVSCSALAKAPKKKDEKAEPAHKPTVNGYCMKQCNAEFKRCVDRCSDRKCMARCEQRTSCGTRCIKD